jgi:hypothetical protein
VKIGRLEPEIWVDNEIASKWKIYISKLKPVKGIEGLIKNIKNHFSQSSGQIFFIFFMTIGRLWDFISP